MRTMEGTTNLRTIRSSQYNKEHYSQIVLRVEKETYKKYKDACNELGVNYTKPLHMAIQSVLSGDFTSLQWIVETARKDVE